MVNCGLPKSINKRSDKRTVRKIENSTMFLALMRLMESVLTRNIHKHMDESHTLTSV